MAVSSCQSSSAAKPREETSDESIYKAIRKESGETERPRELVPISGQECSNMDVRIQHLEWHASITIIESRLCTDTQPSS